MKRGTLRIYLGYAAGVGKTFAMLGEGIRRRERGTRRGHGVRRDARSSQDPGAPGGPRDRAPPHARAPRTRPSRRWMSTRSWPGRPEVVLVDELAHTNVPGSRNEKRWQDVEELLEAGIDVISTVNIQHLESLNDVVERITGVKQRETIPDEVVRAADQVELVDMTPFALRRRMAHGNIYPAEKIDAALAQLLPRGQPRRAARAGAPVDRRPRRRGAAGLHARPRDRGAVGDPGADPGRRLGTRGGRAADPPRGAHGHPSRRRAARRPRDPRGRSGGRSRARDDPEARRDGRRVVPRGGRTRACRRRCSTSPAPRTSRRSCWGPASGSRSRQLAPSARSINRVIRDSGPIDVHVISMSEAPPHEPLRAKTVGRACPRAVARWARRSR